MNLKFSKPDLLTIIKKNPLLAELKIARKILGFRETQSEYTGQNNFFT
jgi:hypothetical protein